MKMWQFCGGWLHSLVILLLAALGTQYSQALTGEEKSKVFLSPEFVLAPGSVENKAYQEVILLSRISKLKRYYQRKDDAEAPEYNSTTGTHNSEHMTLLYFGLGSEAWRTATLMPDSYGIEVGNPDEIPDGYEEKWWGCIECRCDVYNVTKDVHGRPLSLNYEGGLRCCYDKTQCRVKEGFEGARRSLHLRYTLKFIFDITDNWKKPNASTDHSAKHTCLDGCIDIKRTSLTMPTGGHVIYGVSHQHAGGIGSALYGEEFLPVILNQAVSRYLTERMILESNYSSTQKHTGVMGLFYILVAEPSPKPSLLLHAPFHIQSNIKVHNSVWAVALLGMAIIVVAIVGYRGSKQKMATKLLGREVVSQFLSCNGPEIQYRLKGLVC
ncbi:hypothetical protein PVL29_021816 [Vitis rotundifolia]|uniref:Uncharacterized protein n=1 Tax=Vitis rotundifolia TaxID=103349 RepID=A0AA39DAN1_VITRO|nr:hypothetical protein PVL29_021816 [Vitis rotundifolia]